MKDNNSKDNVEGAELVSIPKKDYDAFVARCKEAESLQEKYMRANAEFDNARKRLEKDKVNFLKYANEGLIMDFLPILDNLEMAEKHIEEAKDFKAVREGVDMIQMQIQKFMKDLGVEKIKVLGEKFDPNVHEAVEVDETSDKEDGLIVGELKPGYSLNGKLLRPAMVKIIKKKN